uniref:Uncharacterized protein n=1 Tax=Romanomermis culicivorax TaxID=13658 RepID=A0A915JJY2_ROMCU
MFVVSRTAAQLKLQLCARNFRSSALLKVLSPPIPSFLKKTMIRTTTKEDDEAQNLMLLEMDPATIPTKRVTKKDSPSQGNKNVSTYNKIVPTKDNTKGNLKSGCKVYVSASMMKDAYTNKKDDLMM